MCDHMYQQVTDKVSFCLICGKKKINKEKKNGKARTNPR